MMSNSAERTVILLGGGHAHALCLRELGLGRLRSANLVGTRVILVSDVPDAPYSGMLPGLIAGHYTYDEVHIDLPRLAKFAGAELILAKCEGVDFSKREVLLDNGQKLSFDILSINIGSTPSQIVIPGADRYATPAKPVSGLLSSWESLLKEVKEGRRVEIAIVGGGAGSVELALSMRKRLGSSVPINLLTQDYDILVAHNPGVRGLLRQALSARDIGVRTSTKVQQIYPDKVVDSLGYEYSSTHTFLVTTATAPSWPKESGLAVDSAGFIEVNSQLQSTTHPFVFAAGDIASMSAAPRPKSGVFAVRQAIT